MTDDTPISYEAAARGTPVLSSAGTQIGTLEHVLEVPEPGAVRRVPRLPRSAPDRQPGDRDAHRVNLPPAVSPLTRQRPYPVRRRRTVPVTPR